MSQGPVLEVISEVPKVDSEHPYTTFEGFYMSQKSIKNEVPRWKTHFLHPKMMAFDLIFGAFLEVFLEVIWQHLGTVFWRFLEAQKGKVLVLAERGPPN